MGTWATVVLYVVLMAATIVAVDLLLFRNRFWERLLVNIGIVLVFAAFYLRFLKRPSRRDGVVDCCDRAPARHAKCATGRRSCSTRIA
jgi:hypothetical protein